MSVTPKKNLQDAIQFESKKFEQFYVWLENHLPPRFFTEVDPENLILIAHTLMDFDVQGYFSQLQLKNKAFVLCLDTDDADLKVLKNYCDQGIKNYRAFVSNEPPPFPQIQDKLRIALIYFTEIEEDKKDIELSHFQSFYKNIQKRNPNVSETEFHKMLKSMNSRFLRSLTKERFILAFDVLFRAQSRDPCQIEVRRNQDWEQKPETPSFQIVLAWRNVPKYGFLFELVQVIQRHGLALKRMAATYIEPYSRNHILVISLGLHGAKGKAAWDEADIDDFLQELVTVKYFPGQEIIENTFVNTFLVRGNIGNLLKSLTHFIHQTLVHADPYFYSFNNIEEGLCRHPELTVLLTQAFEQKFHPEKSNLDDYQKTKSQVIERIEKIDTGQESNDLRRKNILKQALNCIDYCLKTNFYRHNKTAHSFRLNPSYLDQLPYSRTEKFPEIPFAIFFMKGRYYTGFHIRFRDLARGGLRTVYPKKMEQLITDKNNLFSECYLLAYTQQKKNKDIPEGGSKGVILLEAGESFNTEIEIYRKELKNSSIPQDEIEKNIQQFQQDLSIEYLYQSQRSYIESFLTLINCDSKGKLRSKHLIDYYNQAEYIYLGPDENMGNEMIEWISSYAKKYHYKPGLSFMSSKPNMGINHKEFGVTSRGVNVYMDEVLRFLKIDPTKESFTIKMTGGPDGDVAGNQMYNLYRFYPKTAKLLGTIDVSGTIFDPLGLDLESVTQLFKESKPIRFYPTDKLSDGGFILDTFSRKQETDYTQQTLLVRKQGGKIVEEWISGNDMNHLLRTNIHQIKADIFIPGGGRPKTLNMNNYKDFLDETGKPTSKAIVEGGNLYLSPEARRALEKLGVIIIKDSSANKGGVICSSFEVLAGLTLTEDEFLKEKPALVNDILSIIEARAKDEAKLLLNMHGKAFLTDVSEWISERINLYTDELLQHLKPLNLDNPGFIHALLNYCPPTLRNGYQDRILKEVPDTHKKAIIACFLAQRLVYTRGLSWAPSIVDILELILNDLNLRS